jgi:hypothetical protein
MRLSRALLSWRLLPLGFLVAALALVGPGTGRASEARPLIGCAPCISSVDPPQGGTVQADASGKVTLTFSAQMVNPFVQFVLTLDGTAVDSTQIQITSNDPLQPTGQYTAALSSGQHSATVEVDDAGGAEASDGWTFTVQGGTAPTSSPSPSPTKTPKAGSGPTRTPTASSPGSTTGTSGGSGGALSPETLSVILFSIAGVGLLVMAFVAGMWFSGRRSLGNGP